MKKFAIVMTVLAMLGTNAAYAQPPGNSGSGGWQGNNKNMGKGSTQSANYVRGEDWAWAIGLGLLAVSATVVGLAWASAANDPISYGH